MDILWKSIVGGILTGLIAWASRRGNVLPGILPLFPTFGVIALYIVGTKGDAGGFRQACVAGMKTIPAYLAFLVACYFAIGGMSFRAALALGLFSWFVVSLLVFLLPGHL